MKVMEIIDRLTSNYAPDDHLVIEWWDKEIAESFAGAEFLNDEEWAKVVQIVENEDRSNPEFASYLADVASDVINKG